uniref:Alpha,alpha-trehalose-phosphate synthase (UDP-forming) n=1 Tax=Noctiluca scintillans TaxID=2966 RepID=A0A7S1AET0_NOCSC|mmetsp:Transcript_43444/g.114527  ORF Transcript_43444/g.114527 Transcript_43444/m.114527 type:complete len:918 (+) Transcript_43444:118-2871(+)|eukprot:CAMPEP_0194518038 /NCGR_PEP_ID=MMETSP0253-20130528/51356_1 /TAXON_ID=2966 /ORGANISM="Noctiluca scintillans" /LENGTH=917 /DNA_ID=CAMNT_0039362059 /DNA_START=44 /DNA_END=2797 /DNA_ORIENTATION=+
MSLGGSFLLPPARQLDKESRWVQEHIKKIHDRRDLEKTFTAQHQQKHAQRRQKILIVANRLPSNAKTDSEGNMYFEPSSGGLVSCLSGIKSKFDMVWIGWPGSEIPEENHAGLIAEAMKQNCYPVFLPLDIINGYYNGFANNVLWPMFHYIMPPFDKGVTECSTAQWEAYRKANELFVEAILQVYEDDDYVWVHDYHLMLVPKILREKKPESNIGWFLHTPFPSAEIYRTLPWRQEIIESLLHANLLAFHVYDYLRHFLSCCVQLTSLEISGHKVDATSLGGCLVTCATVPIGITPEDFTSRLETPEVQEQIQKIRQQYGDRKLILGIDRLDYMKGIPHKLMAFDTLLEQHPELSSQCVLVQLAVPSRREVPEYQRLQREVHELVGQIAGRHSKLEVGSPVMYLDQSMTVNDLVALYHVADVVLITSLRDGMNLVSYEFIACHKGRVPHPGVLILSEFAGAAQSLGAGSIRINPWDLQDTASSIYDALTMNEEDRQTLHDYAYKYITEHTAQKWAETFLQCLQEACSDLMEVTADDPPLLPYEDLLQDWSDAPERVIILDLLECLPDRKRKVSKNRSADLPCDFRQSLQTLGRSPGTTVVVTTDRDRRVLEQVVGDLPVISAPEDCCVSRRPGDSEWRCLVDEGDLAGREEWLSGVKDIFNYFRERTPGSYIELQEYQIRWNWESAQFDFGSAQARDLLIHLWAGPLVNSEAEVVVGDRSITVRPHACARSACLERLLHEEFGDELENVKFALCFAVVSHRDEDVFETLLEMFGPDREVEFVEELESHGGAEDDTSSTSSARSGRYLRRTLGTPRGTPPPILAGEAPPDYDWIPTAQRESELRENEVSSTGRPEEVREEVKEEVAVVDERSRVACRCYTLSLGMKKTKAQHTLPSSYHLQNLIRAMAARLPAEGAVT